jgi:hypothetical protein
MCVLKVLRLWFKLGMLREAVGPSGCKFAAVLVGPNPLSRGEVVSKTTMQRMDSTQTMPTV